MYKYSDYKQGSGATGTPKRAHNHALSSAMSHIQLGILLNDDKLFRTAFKNFEAAINIKEKMVVCLLKQEEVVEQCFTKVEP